MICRKPMTWQGLRRCKFQMQALEMRRDFHVPARIEPFQDSPAARDELVPFLMAQFQGEGACTEAQWHRRLAFWWDDNPFAHVHACRGWVLRDGDRLTGYLGAIPTLYEDAGGNPVPALIATSWAVEEAHRNAALPMGMMLQRQGRALTMVDTTPSPEVQKLLAHWGWTARMDVRHSLLMRGTAGEMLATVMTFDAPELGSALKIITDVTRVSSIRAARPRQCVQKHITPEYLRWYLASPMRDHHFIGVVGPGGMLSSYLVVCQRSIKGLSAWTVVDWFTTSKTNVELHALVTWLMNHSPVEEAAWAPFISLTSFPGEDLWQGLPLAYTRDEKVCHHHWLPPSLKGMPLRPVLAEGDWGL